MTKFSKQAFIDATASPSTLEKLEFELREAVEQSLHPIVQAEMEKIVANLNESGHSLQYRIEPRPGDLHFRDWKPGQCDLMLACDVVISASLAVRRSCRDHFRPAASGLLRTLTNHQKQTFQRLLRQHAA